MARAGRAFLLRPTRPHFSRGIGSPHLTGTVQIPLEWSGTLTSTIPLTSVDTDDEDAWRIPLEWSCVLDIDPVDDVEDP